MVAAMSRYPCARSRSSRSSASLSWSALWVRFSSVTSMSTPCVQTGRPSSSRMIVSRSQIQTTRPSAASIRNSPS